MINLRFLKFIILTSILYACGNSSEQEEVVENPPVFDIQWATLINNEAGLVGSEQQQFYKDHFINYGDIDSTATIYGFNADTGEKDWTHTYRGADDPFKIHWNLRFENLIIASTQNRFFAFNLDTQEIEWQLNINQLHFRPGVHNLAENNMVYFVVDYFQGTFHEVRLLEFEPYNGDYRNIYTFEDDSLGFKNVSPPAYFKKDGEGYLVFNEYEAYDSAPQFGIQNLTAINLETKERLWHRKNISDAYPSNGLYPPVIHNNTVITGGDGTLYAFDLLTGKSKWSFDTGEFTGAWGSTKNLIHNNRLYANPTGFDIYCLNPETGELIWENDVAPNCTDNMLYYEKEDALVFTSWGYGAVMVLDALTGKLIHRETRYASSEYNNDIAYDPVRDLFFTTTYYHAIAFKLNIPN